MQTLRSHNQFKNKHGYGFSNRYRSIEDGRKVAFSFTLLMTIEVNDFSDGDLVDIELVCDEVKSSEGPQLPIGRLPTGTSRGCINARTTWGSTLGVAGPHCGPIVNYLAHKSVIVLLYAEG